MKVKYGLFVFLNVIFFYALSYATTYFVDSGQPDDNGSGLSWAEAKQTLAAAIEASSAGDTILVKYGTYQIADFITIRSDRMITSDDGNNAVWDEALYDSSRCVIKADTSRIFTILSDAVSRATHIRGFKVTGGNATTDTIKARFGGGILIADSAKPVIENCRITNNTAAVSGSGSGGAIAVSGENSEPLIRSCRIDSNIASTGYHGYGGGIYCGSSTSPHIEHNSIIRNWASTYRAGSGGGIYCNGSTAEIWENELSYNIGSVEGAGGAGRGGGIYVSNGDVQIRNNTIMHNTASTARGGDGGGIYIRAHSGEIWDNDILYNIGSTKESSKGGGICCEGDILIHHNLIANNTATTSKSGNEDWKRGYGGGAFVDGHFEYNIVSANKASIYGTGRGGGIYFGTVPYIGFNILSYNIASDSAEGYGGGAWGYNSGHLTFTNNVFYKNANQATNNGAGRGSGIYYWHGWNNVKFKNNVFYGHNLGYSDSTAVFADEETYTIRNNCFYGNGTDYNEQITSLNELNADPRFTDPDNGDFTLLFDSPCIDAGADTFLYDEAENHDYGWVVDIGADEYQGTRVRKTINGTGDYFFGGQVRAKVNVTNPGSMTQIEMRVHPGETFEHAPASVQRWYEIESDGGNALFDVILSYKDAELNGENEKELKVWEWDGANWYGPNPSSDTSTTENRLTVNGLNSFGTLVLSDADSSAALPIGQKSNKAYRFALYQNYPNPFNSITTIRYQLAVYSQIELSVFNLLGQKVATLVKARQPAGSYRVQWDAGRFASGVYVYKIHSDKGYTALKKLILVK